MIDLQDKDICPTIEEIGEYVGNPVFMQFCSEIKGIYKCNEKIEYSSCSWEKGWNIKFKKAGKTLCTIYPRECYLTVMIVVGTKEKPLSNQYCHNVRLSYRIYTIRHKKAMGKDG